MMALGAGGNPRKVQWSAKEDNTTWTPSTTNEAGSFELQTPGGIRCGMRVAGANLILTDADAHTVNYIGYPLVYNRKRIGIDCGVISPKAAVGVESFAVWMGQQGWWIYDGSTVRPLPSDVQDYVFSRLNRGVAEKICGGHNGAFGEIWWFYPSGTNTEPDSYVVWSYRENHWTIGTAGRTSWMDMGAFPYPYAMGTDNQCYRHEDGLLSNGASRIGQCYLRSGAVDFNEGTEILHVRKIIPDEKAIGSVNATFYLRFTPMGAETVKGPYTIRADGYTDARFSGRQFALKLVNTADSDWRIGKFRLEGTIGGNR